jgi:hypothetical protein
VKREVARYGYQTTWERQLARRGKFPVRKIYRAFSLLFSSSHRRLEAKVSKDTTRWKSREGISLLLSPSHKFYPDILDLVHFQPSIGILCSLEGEQFSLLPFDICELTSGTCSGASEPASIQTPTRNSPLYSSAPQLVVVYLSGSCSSSVEIWSPR